MNEGANLPWFSSPQFGLFAFHFHSAAQVSRSWNRIHCNNFFDSHFLEDIDRQRVGYSTVNIQLLADLNRSAGSWDGAAGVNSAGNLARGKDVGFESGEICRHDAQGPNQFRKMHVPDRFL